MSAEDYEEEIINFLPVIPRYGRNTQSRIQNPSVSVGVSSAASSGSHQDVIGKSSVSQQSNIILQIPC